MTLATDEPTVARKFTTANPIEFDFYNQDDERVLYITDDETQLQTLFLEVKNASPHDIELQTPDSTPKPQENGRQLTWDSWMASKERYHVQLSFRPGVLSEKAKHILKEPDFRLRSLTEGWDVQYDPDDTDLTDWISFLWVGADHANELLSALGLPQEDSASIQLNLLARESLYKLHLPKLSAGAGGGARGTRVHLNYQHLVYQARQAIVPAGTRSQFLNIINHQGKRYLPLHVGFVGSNTVLNDGVTANELSLRITNISNAETVTFKDNPASRFTISFDFEHDHEKKEWALTKFGEAAGIHIDWGSAEYTSRVTLNTESIDTVYQDSDEEAVVVIAGWLEQELPKNSLLRIVRKYEGHSSNDLVVDVAATAKIGDDHIYLKQKISVKVGDSVQLVKFVESVANAQWKPELSLQGERLSWRFTYKGDTDYALGPGESILLKLSQIKSSSPTGYTNLYLHYEDIPGYWDGQVTCLIEKAPLVFRHGDVGIGTDMEPNQYQGKPTPKLHVDVGHDNATLAADHKKPAALFMGGDVGIGTMPSQARLDVKGTTSDSNTAVMKLSDSADKLLLTVRNDGSVGIGRQPNQHATLHVDGRIWDKTGMIMPVGCILAYAGPEGEPLYDGYNPGRKGPEGWLICNGGYAERAKYPDLFEILKSYDYAVDNNNPAWFLLPDLRERFIVGANGSGEYKVGAKAGAASVTLTEAQMPSHFHSGATNNDGGHNHTGQRTHVADNDDWDAWGRYIGGREKAHHPDDGGSITSTGSAHSHKFVTEQRGNGVAHENRPPFVALNFIIKY